MTDIYTWMVFEPVLPESEARARFKSKYGHEPAQIFTAFSRLQFVGPVGQSGQPVPMLPSTSAPGGRAGDFKPEDHDGQHDGGVETESNI